MTPPAVDVGQGQDIWLVPFHDVRRVLKVCSSPFPSPYPYTPSLRLDYTHHLSFHQQLFFAEMILYTLTRFFVRASIILFYLRVFPPSQDSKLGRVIQWTMVFNVVYNVSFLFAVIFQCTPISMFWTQWEGHGPDVVGGGHCGNANVLAWVAAATGIAFDLWLLALPCTQLYGLQLHWKKKVLGGMMFFVGVA